MKNYRIVYPLIDMSCYETPKEDEYLTDAKIQEALDEMGALGGGTVALARGVYYISKTLRIPKNVTLCGTAENTTQIYQHDANGREWNLIECEDGATVRDLRINIMGTHKAVIDGKSGLTVERVSILASPYFRWLTVPAENMDGAIIINAVGDKITVRDTEMLGIGRGIVINNGKDINVDSVCVYTSGKGVYLHNCERASVTLCTLRGKTQKANDGEVFGVSPTADCSAVIDCCKDVYMSEIGIHDIRINPSAVSVTDSKNVEINNLLAEIVEYAVVARNSKNVKICGVDAVRCKGVDADGATVEDVRVLVNY